VLLEERATDEARVAEVVLRVAEALRLADTDRVEVPAARVAVERLAAELRETPADEAARPAERLRLGLTADTRPPGMTEGWTAPPRAAKWPSRRPVFQARPLGFQGR
jgi:hypothetical protein